jgi:hypothetical protein
LVPGTEPTPADAGAEHIYIGSDDAGDLATTAREVRSIFTLTNPLRRAGTRLTLYEEGVLAVAALRNGEPTGGRVLLDLRYLDSVPTIERVIAVRCLYTALGCGATAALAAFLLRFDALHTSAMAVLAATALIGLGALGLAVRSSHEKIEFCTRHGRATVLRLVATFGSMKKLRAFVPALSTAIEGTRELIADDPAAFLRAEMREHYRLRSEGALDNDACAAGTGRILAQFDAQL